MNFEEVISNEQSYRLKQIYQGWFDPTIKNYNNITTLPSALREKLKDTNFLSVRPQIIIAGKKDVTEKALLELHDHLCVETVLMGRENKKENNPEEYRYTICVSTQAGCPMGCAFCATGKLGFQRNLSAYEIIDQYRFWMQHLAKKNEGEIDNIVLMGQGEPMANYESVKKALQIILDYTDIGPRQITISTVGVKNGMEQMLADKDFPPVRFALSLHSALEESRKALIPSHPPDFFPWLIDWAKRYHQKFTSRTHFIGIEYTMIKGKNDDSKHLKALIKLASQIGKTRINLIPYNSTLPDWQGTDIETMKQWRDELMQKGFITTIRHSQGQDIMAACGQLANKNKKI